jgi:hypothetical protein
MSVWLNSGAHGSVLTGTEGDLVSVSIGVQPGDLETLLEALAELDFPVNPQIYHHAAIDYVYPDGREVSEPLTVVEFPAYAPRVPAVRAAVASYGLDADRVYATGMLEEIHAGWQPLPAPAGAPYRSRILRKHAVH